MNQEIRYTATIGFENTKELSSYQKKQKAEKRLVKKYGRENLILDDRANACLKVTITTEFDASLIPTQIKGKMVWKLYKLTQFDSIKDIELKEESSIYGVVSGDTCHSGPSVYGYPDKPCQHRHDPFN